MAHRVSRWIVLAASCLPLAVASQTTPSAEPTAEQVYKNIEVFKGVPARDLVPSMEFMAGALRTECTGCHDPKDFAVDTEKKRTARRMIGMQRDLNARYFNGRLEVTCMTCHNGKERPASTPLPDGATLRHPRADASVRVEDLLARHIKAVGPESVAIRREGKQFPPYGPAQTAGEAIVNDVAPGHRFAFVGPSGKFGSDGKSVWRDGEVLVDEPAGIFGRLGRTWRGPDAFAGLTNLRVNGKETVAGRATTIVRGTRAATGTTEELYFEDRTGTLLRFVNLTPSTLGNVVTVYDYDRYKTVGGAKVPTKVTATFAGGDHWIFDFKTVREASAPNATFSAPSPK